MNRTEDGWLLLLSNNRGVYKEGHRPAIVKAEEKAEVTILFDGLPREAREEVTGEALRAGSEDGRAALRLVVPAGDVRLVRWKE